MKNNILFQIFLCLIIFLIFISLGLFQGEFLDGLTYASISRNLAEGKGTYFQLFYNEFLYPTFYEHPPFFFIVQSFFFTIFGDHFFVEKVFGFLSFILSAFIISKIIKEKYLKTIPIYIIGVSSLFFFTYVWVFKNNMLESLLIPLILLAYYISVKKNIALVLRSILFCIIFILSFLTKGPFCFFILPMFLIEYFSIEITSIRKITLFYLVLIVTLAISIFIFYQIPITKSFFTTYFQNQVLKSLKGEREVSSRSIYVIQFIYAIIPIVLLWVISFFKHKKIDYKKYKTEYFLMFLYSVSILISPKQNSYYIAAIIPFMIILFADQAYDYYQILQDKLSKNRAVLISICVFLFFANFIVVFYTYNQPTPKLKKYIYLSNELKQKPQVAFAFSDELSNDWRLIAVLSRFNNHQISAKSNYVLRNKKAVNVLKDRDLNLDENYYLEFKQLKYQ